MVGEGPEVSYASNSHVHRALLFSCLCIIEQRPTVRKKGVLARSRNIKNRAAARSWIVLRVAEQSWTELNWHYHSSPVQRMAIIEGFWQKPEGERTSNTITSFATPSNHPESTESRECNASDTYINCVTPCLRELTSTTSLTSINPRVLALRSSVTPTRDLP